MRTRMWRAMTEVRRGMQDAVNKIAPQKWKPWIVKEQQNLHATISSNLDQFAHDMFSRLGPPNESLSPCPCSVPEATCANYCWQLNDSQVCTRKYKWPQPQQLHSSCEQILSSQAPKQTQDQTRQKKTKNNSILVFFLLTLFVSDYSFVWLVLILLFLFLAFFKFVPLFFTPTLPAPI